MNLLTCNRKQENAEMSSVSMLVSPTQLESRVTGLQLGLNDTLLQVEFKNVHDD